MSLTKVIIVTLLCVIAFNLFYYARYQRVMAEAKRRLAEEEAAARENPDQAMPGEAEQKETE